MKFLKIRRIRKKRQQMAEASSRYAKMINQLGPLEQKMYQLDYAIGRALDECQIMKRNTVFRCSSC